MAGIFPTPANASIPALMLVIGSNLSPAMDLSPLGSSGSG
jgi:hypothetical protein